MERFIRHEVQEVMRSFILNPQASKCSSRMDTESCGGSSTGGIKAELAPGDRFLENGQWKIGVYILAPSYLVTLGLMYITISLSGVHLKFNLEAGTLLLLAFRGRLRHGRHFTFKSGAFSRKCIDLSTVRERRCFTQKEY